MTLNTGLTTLHEDDIAKHQAVAQSLVTKLALLERDEPSAGTPLAGTGRRFVSTVSTGGQRRTREVELARTIQTVRGADPLLSPAQHGVLYRTRRGIQVALAVADVFARQTNLEQLQARNAATPLAGEDASHFKALLSAAAYVAAFTLAAYLGATLQGEGEPVDDAAEPDFLFDTPQDALKSMVAALDRSIAGAPDDLALTARARAFSRVAIEGLLARKARFSGLQNFENVHLRLDQDDFTLNGFDVAPGQKRKPLVMTFKKPDEIIGNHIAKYQALKLAKMLMAYDFDRQMNPFVELGGFLFTFIGDGMPGTGKTILIQMLAGMLHDYCGVAGYAFHYENFGVDQISSYQANRARTARSSSTTSSTRGRSDSARSTMSTR
ncbi:hypothetical protein AB395_00002420 [Sinorhizobium fredii CCBAU 45436]|nr:hypothetical protein AB395_00002420 [Sinorhizobium fredii CCBAU 45436]